MPAYAGAGLQDIYPGMLVGNADDLVHIHAVRPADLGQLVGIGNVDIPEGIFYHLGHLRGADIRKHDLALAEAGVNIPDARGNLRAVSADGAVVAAQLIEHVAGDDPLRGMGQLYILPAKLCQQRPQELIHSAGRNGGFHHNRSPLGANAQHGRNGAYYIFRVDLLGIRVIRGGNGYDIGIGNAVFGSKGNARGNCLSEQLFQPFLLKSGAPAAQGVYQRWVIVCANNFYAVGCQHQGGGQADIAKANYIYHKSIFLYIII